MEIPRDLNRICSLQVIDYTTEDVSRLEKLFNIDASILNSSDDIEISSHYLEGDRQLAFNFSFPYLAAQNYMEEVVVCFILTKDIMFSFMAINFEQFIPENQKQKQFENIRTLPFSLDAFLLLMIGIVSDYFADLTEVIAKASKPSIQICRNKKRFLNPN